MASSTSTFSLNSITSIISITNFLNLKSSPFFQLYLNIRLTASKWDSWGFTWNLAHWHTLYMISGLLDVRYNNEPMIPLYIMEYGIHWRAFINFVQNWTWMHGCTHLIDIMHYVLFVIEHGKPYITGLNGIWVELNMRPNLQT